MLSPQPHTVPGSFIGPRTQGRLVSHQQVRSGVRTEQKTVSVRFCGNFMMSQLCGRVLDLSLVRNFNGLRVCERDVLPHPHSRVFSNCHRSQPLQTALCLRNPPLVHQVPRLVSLAPCRRIPADLGGGRVNSCL